MVLRTCSSYTSCNKHPCFRRFCPTKRLQTMDLIDQSRKLAAAYPTHSIADPAVNFEMVPGAIKHQGRGRQPNRSDQAAIEDHPRQVQTNPPTIGVHAVWPEPGRTSGG